MSSYNLKIIALISMIIDHIGYVIFPKYIILRYIGRLAFPIYAFLASEGITHTRNIKKYIKTLFILALISEPIFDLCFNTNISFLANTNTIFTLLISVFSIYLFHMNTNFFYRIFCLFFGIFIAIIITPDYNILGVLLVYLFYFFKKKKDIILYGIIWSIFMYPNILFIFLDTKSAIFNIHIYRDILFAISSFVSFILIYFYNGKRGRYIKNLFYIAYPLHLFIIYLISL